MLKTVTKRDGRVEQADPEKLARWAKWAAGIGVDWFEIAARAYAKVSDGVSTKELQAALISSAEDLRTTEGLLMAGRLAIGDLYKQVFGSIDNIPSLKVQYHNMIAQGYQQDLGYSDEELDYLETVIDHSKDLVMSLPQVRQDIQKYLISDIVSKQVKETPQFAVMRQAMGACKNEERSVRLERVAALYNMIADSFINTPTPNKQNLGTDKTSYASCCKSAATDTLGSIEAQNHIYWAMTAASAGQGGVLFTRSYGDKIRGGVIKHGGKIPYYRLQQAEVKANLQGCYDDTTEILTENGWKLFGELSTKEKVAQVHPSGASEFVTPLRVMEYDYKGPMVAFNSDRRGVSLLVTPNHRMISWRVRHNGTSSNLPQGEVRVDATRVMGGEFVVTHASEFVCSDKMGVRLGAETMTQGPALTPEQRFEIAYQADGAEKCTNNYGYTFRFKKQRKIEEFRNLLACVGYKYTENVQISGVHSFYVNVGRKLSKQFGYNLSEVSREWCLEFLKEVVKWDGCAVMDTCKEGITYSTTVKHNADFVQAVAALAGWQSSIRNSDRSSSGRARIYKVCAVAGNISSSRAWEKRYEDYDGKVYCVEVPTGAIIVRRSGRPVVCGNSRGGALTTYLNALDPEIFTLLALRNPTSVDKKRVDSIDYAFSFNNSFVERAKNNQDWLLISFQKAPDLWMAMYDPDCKRFDALFEKYKSQGQVVKARDLLKRFLKEDSVTGRLYEFNATNVNSHRAFLETIWSSNLCLEYLAPTHWFDNVTQLYATGAAAENVKGEVAICNLAAISVGKFEMTPESYERVAFHALLMVDNVIDAGTFPLPQVEYTAKARRTAGVGITNLAYAMAKQGFKYSSQEGKDFCHRLAELHTFSLLKASVRLAKEKGKCKWFDKTRYSRGWLPIDTYNKEVDRITQQPLLCDWERLRAEIAKYGLRNSALVNHMPVESSAVRANDTNGLYPVRDGIVIKSSGNTEAVFIPPEWEALKDSYQLAWDVPSEDMADIYAIFQKFADQGISADVYQQFKDGEKKSSLKMLMNDFFYRQKIGLKTRYYRNFKIGAAELEQEEACGAGGCKL